MTDLGDVIRIVRSLLPFGDQATAGDSPLPFTSRRPPVNPILPVADMAEATGFYGDLGFVVERYDDQYAWVKHCGWELVHLRLVAGLAVETNETTAFVHIGDVDGWRRAMLSTTTRPACVGSVRDEPWGMREFAVSDPSGNVVRYGTNS